MATRLERAEAMVAKLKAEADRKEVMRLKNKLEDIYQMALKAPISADLEVALCDVVELARKELGE